MRWADCEDDEEKEEEYLKERPASSGYGAQKRNISEVLSDHSFSS